MKQNKCYQSCNMQKKCKKKNKKTTTKTLCVITQKLASLLPDWLSGGPAHFRLTTHNEATTTTTIFFKSAKKKNKTKHGNVAVALPCGRKPERQGLCKHTSHHHWAKSNICSFNTVFCRAGQQQHQQAYEQSISSDTCRNLLQVYHPSSKTVLPTRA